MPVYELALNVAKLNAGATDAITILKKVSSETDKTDKSFSKMGAGAKVLNGSLKLAQSGAREVANGIKDAVVQMAALYGAAQALSGVMGL